MWKVKCALVQPLLLVTMRAVCSLVLCCAVLCAFKKHPDVPIARTGVPTEYL